MQLHRHRAAALAAGLTFAAIAGLGSFSASARSDDHRGGRHERDWHRDRGGGYYGPPPLVYGTPYYAPPPVVYGPGIGLNIRIP
jgi:hypothetical protein